jgi:type I restriction enzyme S subunit
MPWPTMRLCDIARRIGGGTPSREEKANWNGNLPWFTVADLSDVDDVQTLTTSREAITPRGLEHSATKRIPAGAVVFSSRVVVGKVGIAANELATNQDFSSFVPSGLMTAEFLAYFLIKAKYDLRIHQRGATIKGVTTDVLDTLDIPVPPLNQQRQTVAVIKECMLRIDEAEKLRSSIDEESNLLRTATVSAKVKEFKQEFRCATVGQLVAGDPSAMRSGPFGSAMKHDEFVPEGTLVIGIANVQQNRFDPVRKWMISDQKFEKMKRYQVAPGDLLVTIMGTIGRTCVVPPDVGPAITSKHVYRIRFPRTNICPEYISYVMNFDDDARNQLYGTAAGGVMPGLNSTKLKSLSLPIPTLSIQQTHVDLWDEIHAALSEREILQSSSEISDLRAAILHKAFAGEL